MSSLGVGSQLLVTSPQDCGEVVETSPKQEGHFLELGTFRHQGKTCKVWGQGPHQQLQAQLVQLREDGCRRQKPR